VKKNQTVASDKWQVTSAGSRTADLVTRHPSPLPRRSEAKAGVTRTAFTLIEVMVVMALLSLIVIALMGVFNSTQAAFRASVTQTDVLEGGRAAMDLMSGDLRAMSPSRGVYTNLNGCPVNFYAGVANAPLFTQPLIASSNQQRTNVLEEFFILSRENQTWTGTGYVVITNSVNGNPYSLYRFSMTTNVSAANGPLMLFNNFINSPYTTYTNSPPWSHLLDGVITLRVRAYDPNGIWLTNGYAFQNMPTIKNTYFFAPVLGEVGFLMYSNTLPASVEIEMATLEDRTLQRAESRPVGPLRDAYLQGQAGKVHVFRQRVAIPNVDPAAYR
jgi:prepilin-type N-terminal cleavage/methylation domain-containing protein